MRRIDVELRHAAIEVIETFFALRSADDFADAGRQHVHRRDGFAVVVQAHVERLDLLRIIHHDDGTADVFLGEIALVLGLQIVAPFDREVELLAGLFQDFDRIGVVDALERRVDECFEARDDGLLLTLGEELHVVHAFVRARL